MHGWMEERIIGRCMQQMLALVAFGEHSKAQAAQWALRVPSVFARETNVSSV